VTLKIAPNKIRVRCHASAPGNGRTPHACNTLLADLPRPVRFVKIAVRAPEPPDGRIWLKCSRRDCRTWNVFEESDG
jgi:hypothetical protein